MDVVCSVAIRCTWHRIRSVSSLGITEYCYHNSCDMHTTHHSCLQARTTGAIKVPVTYRSMICMAASSACGVVLCCFLLQEQARMLHLALCTLRTPHHDLRLTLCTVVHCSACMDAILPLFFVGAWLAGAARPVYTYPSMPLFLNFKVCHS